MIVVFFDSTPLNPEGSLSSARANNSISSPGRKSYEGSSSETVASNLASLSAGMLSAVAGDPFKLRYSLSDDNPKSSSAAMTTGSWMSGVANDIGFGSTIRTAGFASWIIRSLDWILSTERSSSTPRTLASNDASRLRVNATLTDREEAFSLTPFRTTSLLAGFRSGSISKVDSVLSEKRN